MPKDMQAVYPCKAKIFASIRASLVLAIACGFLMYGKSQGEFQLGCLNSNQLR
jgi:hypothetical protein